MNAAMNSSNKYLRYRRIGGSFGGYNALALGISVAFLEVYLRVFGLAGGESRSDSDFIKLLLSKVLCGFRETPWANFSDVLLVLTFLAAAVIGVFVAGGNVPSVENNNFARGRASGVSRGDLADEAVERCAFFVAVYLWRTLILASAKILVAVFLSEGSVREQVPDLIIFGALVVGILGCRWINRVLIPGVHVLRLSLDGMERRKWRLALLDAELTRSLKLDCGVGKHAVPLAGKRSHCVWIIRWLPVVRVLLSVLFFGVLCWVSPRYLEVQDKEKAAWIATMILGVLVGVFEFVAALVDKGRQVERCLKCFVEGSRAPSWGFLVFGNGLRLLAIVAGVPMFCLTMFLGDHNFSFLGALCLIFVILDVAASFVAVMPGMHRKEGLWDASWWTELKEWKEKSLGNVSPDQARCALVLQDYISAETGGRFKWLRSPIAWVRKSQGPAGKSIESMKNRIEKSCALLADAIEDMGGRKSPIQ